MTSALLIFVQVAKVLWGPCHCFWKSSVQKLNAGYLILIKGTNCQKLYFNLFLGMYNVNINMFDYERILITSY